MSSTTQIACLGPFLRVSGHYLVALSTADTNKWLTLLEKRHPTSRLEATHVDYERIGPIRQRQRRLTESQVKQMAARYYEGATVFVLAKEFGIRRATVSERLKKAGVSMRCQSPKSELIDSMAELYESGMSVAEVGDRVGTSPGTVHRYLLIYGIQMRDSHGRIRLAKPPLDSRVACPPSNQLAGRLQRM